MWLNCMQVNITENAMISVLNILSDESNLKSITNANGFCCQCLMESTEIPGELLVFTGWENACAGQAYLASPEYQQVIARIREFLSRPLEQHYYTITMQLSKAEISDSLESNQWR